MNDLKFLSRNQPANPARSDFVWVLMVTALTFMLCSALELQERLSAWVLRFETWQADEIPLTLVALSFGLAWYAWRRSVEASQLLAHNRELAQQLIVVQEIERVALARELHDELAQHCTAIRLEAAYVQRSHDAALIAAAAERIASAAQFLQHSVRNLVRRLRPAELDELGLTAALQALCQGWQERSGLGCAFHHHGDLSNLGEAADTALYRVAQEALSNVVRHAQASSVCVELRATPNRLDLRVEDDGRGFDASIQTRGLGLLGATERAAALGGQLQAVSRPGQGTRIRMQLPRLQGLAA